MSITETLQRFFVFLAVVTSMGTLVHDTRLNKVAEVAAPISNISIDFMSNLETLSHASSHTHVEEAAAASQSPDGVPRIQARDEHRKYLIPKVLSRSNSFFGESGYIWPSI
jgi:hypothetical protein